MKNSSTYLNNQQKETELTINPKIFSTMQNMEKLSKKQLIFETPLELICERCGCKVTFTKISVSGLGIRFLLNNCSCEKKRREEEDKLQFEEKLAITKKAKIEKFFKMSQLGERFRNISFQNWENREGTELVYKTCEDFVINFEQYRKTGESLLIYGNPGNGKTHLSAAMAGYLLKKGYSVIFQVVPDMLDKIRATYSSNQESEIEIVNSLISADLLILDDLGAQKLSEWNESKIYQIINARYAKKLPIVITANIPLLTFETYTGSRVWDRLLEICTIVENQGESYRKKAAMERIKNNHR